jgi:putative nucleotidyltransferase-like protein
MPEAAVDATIRSIAAFGLSTTHLSDPPALMEEHWQALLARVRTERLSGLAVESATRGWLRLDEPTFETLLSYHRESMAWCLLIEKKLLRLADGFDAAGVRFAVLKGASVAHAVYPDTSLRSFGDLDILVPSADYDRACELLHRLGHVRQQPEPRAGFDSRFGKASVHVHPNDGIEVDLHRTLVLGPFGLWMQPEELMESAATFEIGGRRIARLDDTGLLLNTATHAALGWWPPRLVPLRDVVQVTRFGAVEWSALERWCRAWQLTAVLDRAFSSASESLGVERPEELERIVRSVPRMERRALRHYEGRRREAGGTALATVRAIPGLRSKAAYLAALLFPRWEFLDARTRSGRRPSYLRRLAVPAQWMRSRL